MSGPTMKKGEIMTSGINVSALNTIFCSARSRNKFLESNIDDSALQELYDLYKWGPTSMNCQPGRIVFVRSKKGKEMLRPALTPGNVDKTMHAPVTAIIAYDAEFYEKLPSQFPANPNARQLFASNPELANETAFRNSSLQGAYLIIAARALGLSAGPMSGFDPALINATFFPDGRWKANFLVNFGFGDKTGDHPRGPRLEFGEVTRIL